MRMYRGTARFKLPTKQIELPDGQDALNFAQIGISSPMRRLSITPQPGMKARVHYVAPYDLPDELEEGDEITVMNFSTGFCDV